MLLPPSANTHHDFIIIIIIIIIIITIIIITIIIIMFTIICEARGFSDNNSFRKGKNSIFLYEVGKTASGGSHSHLATQPCYPLRGGRLCTTRP